ncbi:unnamed protein product [Bursaphelenchus okinawaensis]|uniref:Uncharacterized protein n=1 Tax=Bursaphelenchus okinawaensis TaxID=465554 RepID=A0A811LU96_9BILA|nr:unnamed protein product [Bursaphelenchus okinawaensis]CAG9128163.1 unnamed protein product [Bursaphelenchus okinawaensis]
MAVYVSDRFERIRECLKMVDRVSDWPTALVYKEHYEEYIAFSKGLCPHQFRECDDCRADHEFWENDDSELSEYDEDDEYHSDESNDDGCSGCERCRLEHFCLRDIKLDCLDKAFVTNKFKGLVEEAAKAIQELEDGLDKLSEEVKEVKEIRTTAMTHRREFLEAWNKMAEGQKHFSEIIRQINAKDERFQLKTYDKTAGRGDEKDNIMELNDGLRKLHNKKEKERKKLKKKQAKEAEKKRLQVAHLPIGKNLTEGDEPQDSDASDSDSDSESDNYDVVLNEEIFQEVIRPHSPVFEAEKPVVIHRESTAKPMLVNIVNKNGSVIKHAAELSNQFDMTIEVAVEMGLNQCNKNPQEWQIAFVHEEYSDDFLEKDAVFDWSIAHIAGVIPIGYQVTTDYWTGLILVSNSDNRTVWPITQSLSLSNWHDQCDSKSIDLTVTMSYTIYDEYKVPTRSEITKMKIKYGSKLLELMCQGFKEAGIQNPQHLTPCGIIRKVNKNWHEVKFYDNVERDGHYQAVLKAINTIEQATAILHRENVIVRIAQYPVKALDLVRFENMARFICDENVDIGTLNYYKDYSDYFSAKLMNVEEHEKLYHVIVRRHSSPAIIGLHTVKSASLNRMKDLKKFIEAKFNYDPLEMAHVTVYRSNRVVVDGLYDMENIIPNQVYTFVIED